MAFCVRKIDAHTINFSFAFRPRLVAKVKFELNHCLSTIEWCFVVGVPLALSYYYSQK